MNESTILTPDPLQIRVTSDWNGWHGAEVRLRDIHGLHWRQPDGAPKPLLHGYVACTDVLNGDMPHQCELRSAPHPLLVCIIRRHTVPALYAELVRRIDDPQPESHDRVRPSLADVARSIA
jgi:hypothetical protein